MDQKKNDEMILFIYDMIIRARALGYKNEGMLERFKCLFSSLCFDGFMDAPYFSWSEYKLHPETSPFNFSIPYGMAVSRIDMGIR